MLTVNEIFYSIQGESSFTGMPCVFVRLTYCNLRCSYCDTEYAFYEGSQMSIQEVIDEVKKFSCNLVEITGGEPLMQSESLKLMKQLNEEGYCVLLETGGSLPIEDVDPGVKIIMDLKCPSSGMMGKNRLENLRFIKSGDEVKFVIGNSEDYLWAKDIIRKYDLTGKAAVLFSPVFGVLNPDILAKWILGDKLNVRLQLQIHKYIWNPEMRGV